MTIFDENQEIIDINSTYDAILNETDLSKMLYDTGKNNFTSNLIGADSNSKVYKMRRPTGVIFSDTVNNLFYPISDPKIDTSNFDLPKLYRSLQELTGVKLDFLPWHFIVEFIQNKYYIFNTRPLDMKFPIQFKECKKFIETNNIKLDTKTSEFFNTIPFDIQTSIHVAIIGDSQNDIYMRKVYELIGRNCIGPILRYFNLPTKMWQKVYAFNVGQNFSTETLDLYLTR